MKKLLLIALTLPLIACGAEGIRSEQSSNGVSSTLIATVEGCNVWRIRDGNMRSVYATICPSSTSNSWSESCGKSCIETKTLDTVRKP